MNKTETLDFLKKLVDRAIAFGFEEAEASFSSDSHMEINIFEGEVSSYENSNTSGIAFIGKKNGQMGGASTSDFSDESIEYILKSSMENCEVKDDEDEDFFYCDPDNSNLENDERSGNYDKNTYNRFSELGLKLEKDILAISPDIKAVDYLSISCCCGPTYLANSKGLTMYKDGDLVFVMAEARAERDGVVKTGGHFWAGHNIDDFDEAKFLEKVGKKVLGKLGASSVDSGSYKVVLDKEAFVSLFDTFESNFSAYSMQKGLSLLAGKEGEKIASDCFTIREEPMYKDALLKFPFDDQGVITYSKALIDNGVFVKALHNLKTANKEGIPSTGNFFKGIKASNLVVTPGNKSFDEILETVQDGLYITELNGLHAGVNRISGDFSLFCEGYLIKNGRIERPVEQITVSDNFYDLLKKIEEVGGDLEAVEEGVGEYFCPSIVISEMNIAGSNEEEG